MTGHFGFSYVGVLFLLMLFIPNILWAGKKPQDYTSETESRILLIFERIGQALTCCCVLIFSDFNIHKWTTWSWWLIVAVLLMILYELWWIRYFRSEKKLQDFYRGFCGIPLAGATLPVLAFMALGIYGKVIWMILSVAVLGIGHIGIHMEHWQKMKKNGICN